MSSSSSSSDEYELATYEENDKPAHKHNKQVSADDDDEGENEDEMGRAALYEDDQEMAIVSKYAKVNQPCPFSQHPPKQHINLEWRNINYKVVFPMPPSNFFVKLLLKLPIPNMILNLFKKKMEMPILNNVSGSVRSGELIAIMGPTGSGKTTLLNVLARRIKLNVTGDILVNGEAVQGRRLKRRMAYVLQDDIFFPNLTVRDTISYTAYLKLPKSLSWKEKREKVDEIITELGIQRCSNTIVGGGWVRGVSGGERKRTNIANELVANPSLIFLDEPTSGLDSSTSLGLIVSMKNLAKSGHTVVSTIHQPSSSMFLMFDHVLLLAEGGFVVYSGTASGVLSYFAKLGLHAPPHYNPADFMLEVVTANETLKDGKSVKQMLIDTYAENQKTIEGKRPPITIGEEERSAVQDIKKGRKYNTSFHAQMFVMAMRAFKQRRGDILNWMQTFTIVAIAILSGLLWFQMDMKESALGDRTGFLFFTTMFWIMQPWFNALYSFPPERAVLTKERAGGNYRLSAYFLGKTVAETPLELVLPFISSVISYWMVGLSEYFPNFIFYVVLVWLFTLMGGSIGLFISATVLDVKKALTLTVIVVLGSVLLGGFFISAENLPVWIAWARWISFMKYAYEAVLINEFDLSQGQTFIPSNPSSYDEITNPATQRITGSMVLNKFNVETNIWGDIIFLVGVIVVCRTLAYLSLRFLNKPRM